MKIDLRSLLTKFVASLRVVATLTPIKSDDALVAFIDAALADAELLGWVEKKVATAEAGTLSLETEPPAEMQIVLGRHNLTWQQAVAAVELIAQVWRIFRG